MRPPRALTATRFVLGFFAAGLVVSGLSAIFAREGLHLLSPLYSQGSALAAYWPSMAEWLMLVDRALEVTHTAYPFLAYGYDWLAFGHFIIAVPFLMALRDPVRNSWVFGYGIAACLAVLPFALVFGAIRGIPVFRRGVDALFGLGGLGVLLILRRLQPAGRAMSA